MHTCAYTPRLCLYFSINIQKFSIKLTLRLPIASIEYSFSSRQENIYTHFVKGIKNFLDSKDICKLRYVIPTVINQNCHFKILKIFLESLYHIKCKSICQIFRTNFLKSIHSLFPSNIRRNTFTKKPGTQENQKRHFKYTQVTMQTNKHINHYTVVLLQQNPFSLSTACCVNPQRNKDYYEQEKSLYPSIAGKEDFGQILSNQPQIKNLTVRKVEIVPNCLWNIHYILPDYRQPVLLQQLKLKIILSQISSVFIKAKDKIKPCT
eukprot:TRINITY_DN14058_c0_g2_i1.p3 TRINITY_DN14058_c0_g2~~TRINITY_DN14058_c0_g2_i1.p3  ORF type:complete len:264 (+),score=-20.77 TRINITY_DN14058_c0_g2_i1:911-1702(+)